MLFRALSGTVALHAIDSPDVHIGVVGAAADHFLSFNSIGLPQDSGYLGTSFSLSSHSHTFEALSDVAVFTPAKGQVLFRDTSSWNILAPGTAGYVLTTQGAGAAPNWTAAGNMTKAVYDANADNMIDPAAGGTGINTSSSTGYGYVGAGTWAIKKANLNAAVPPSVNDDVGAGYAVGSDWIDTTHNKIYICIKSTAGAAVWGDVSLSGGDMSRTTYDTNTDGKVDTAAGGTGLDTSASTGFPHLLSGSWQVKKSNLSAVVAPTVNDDSSAGYAIGSEWIDTTQPKAYVCLDTSIGYAVWTEITGGDMAKAVYDVTADGLIDAAAGGLALDTSILTGYPHVSGGTWSVEKSTRTTTSPAVTDDSGAGYEIGSRWINTVTSDEYVCISAGSGAAMWVKTTAAGGDMSKTVYDSDADSFIDTTAGGTGFNSSASTGLVYITAGAWSVILSNFAAAVAPSASNDITEGYSVGSLWLDTTHTKAYYCLDNSTGYAVWIDISGAAGDMTKVVYDANTDNKIDTNKGGTGLDSSAATGFAHVSSGTWAIIKSNSTTTSPGVSDDSSANYAVGSRWLNTTTADEYVCTDASVGAAVWIRTTLKDVAREICIKLISDTDALTTGDGKQRWTVPSLLNGFSLTEAQAHVYTVSSSGLPNFQINNETTGNDMLSTAITVDVSEYDSSTAAAPSVVNSSYKTISTADVIRFDVDTAGTGTKGAEIRLRFTPVA